MKAMFYFYLQTAIATMSLNGNIAKSDAYVHLPPNTNGCMHISSHIIYAIGISSVHSHSYNSELNDLYCNDNTMKNIIRNNGIKASSICSCINAFNVGNIFINNIYDSYNNYAYPTTALTVNVNHRNYNKRSNIYDNNSRAVNANVIIVYRLLLPFTEAPQTHTQTVKPPSKLQTGVSL